MNQNPYAPSRASLSRSEAAFQNDGDIGSITLSGSDIFSVSMRMMSESFLPLCGAGLLWAFTYLLVGNSFLGIVAMPHLAAGRILAGYRYYKNQGSVHQIFDGFQEFGPVLGFGFLFFLAALALFILSGLIVFGAFIAGMTFNQMQANEFFVANRLIIIWGIIATSAFLVYSFFYMAARTILVYPLIVYFNHDARSAFSLSIRATANCGHTIALQAILFDFVFLIIGTVILCMGLIPALGVKLAFRGAVVGLLLDQLYPDTVINDRSSSHLSQMTQSMFKGYDSATANRFGPDDTASDQTRPKDIEVKFDEIIDIAAGDGNTEDDEPIIRPVIPEEKPPRDKTDPFDPYR